METDLPDHVVVDVHGAPQERFKSKKKKKPKAQLKLFFQCRCPDEKEVRLLHPAIKRVFKPKRKANVRYCILEFSGAACLEEVRSALDGKHVEPYPGILRCSISDSNLRQEKGRLIPNFPESGHVPKLEIRHLRRISAPSGTLPEDVINNSTARELFIRYGVTFEDNMSNGTLNNLSPAVLATGEDDAINSEGEDDSSST